MQIEYRVQRISCELLGPGLLADMINLHSALCPLRPSLLKAEPGKTELKLRRRYDTIKLFNSGNEGKAKRRCRGMCSNACWPRNT